MSEEQDLSFVLLSTDQPSRDALGRKLSKKSSNIVSFSTLDEALDFLSSNKITHMMIDLTFTPFEKAKFLKNLKSVAIIAPKVKTVSFKDILNKFNPDDEKVFVGGKIKENDDFAYEVHEFIAGDKLDVSSNFSQLYKHELKTFVQFGQLPTVVEFLEMTKTGMVVYSNEAAIVGEEAIIKIENFMNKKDSVLEINAIISKIEKEDTKYFVELELNTEFIDKWKGLYEEYVERQLAIDEFLFNQRC